MIQWMHRLSQSWVATILMGALALSFVVWGIADVFTGGSSTAVATVGSTEIDSTAFARSYRNFVRNQSQQMGTNITPDMAEKMGLSQTALQQLVSRTALDNAISNMKLGVSDAALRDAVRTMDAFKGATGQFDHATFLRAIQNAGYDEDTFLGEMRADLTRQQATAAFEQGFRLPDGYAQALYQYVTEKRAADYVIVSPDSVGAIAPPGDAALAAYVKENPARFSTPEYRQIEYATIGPQDIVAKADVTDAMVAQDYAAHKSTYDIPEKRTVQQIEFPTEAEAKAGRAKLDGGEKFEALAAERKIKPADLALGELAKSELPDAARANAAFSLKENEVSQPIKGAFSGFVLMRVTKIAPGVSHPLSEVADTIKKNLAMQQASGKLVDIINAFEDARSGGATIAAAAQKTGMKSGRFTALDKSGMMPTGEKPADLPADPEFLEQAFKAEPGEDNDPFAAKSGVYYAVKVDGVTQPKLKPLDLVRADAIAAWTEGQKTSALAKKAGLLADEAKKDKSLDGIAKELKVPVQHSPGLGRDTNDTTFSATMTGEIFSAPPDGIVIGPQAVGPNFIIAQVSGINHATPTATDATFQGGKTQLSAQAAGDLSTAFANAARLSQGVKVNQKVLQSAIGSGQ